MKNHPLKFFAFMLICGGWMLLSSWTLGPVPECAKDSLAIVRVIKPLNEVFDIKPVLYVSKGEGKIDQVEMTDSEMLNGELLLKKTLTELLYNGYTIQTTTETVDNGLKLNTYYLKKKMI